MAHTHLCVDIQWLLNQVNNMKPWKKRDWLSRSFGADNYSDLCRKLYQMEIDWKQFFTSDECDNILPNWRCWWHDN